MNDTLLWHFWLCVGHMFIAPKSVSGRFCYPNIHTQYVQSVYTHMKSNLSLNTYTQWLKSWRLGLPLHILLSSIWTLWEGMCATRRAQWDFLRLTGSMTYSYCERCSCKKKLLLKVRFKCIRVFEHERFRLETRLRGTPLSFFIYRIPLYISTVIIS